MTCMNRFKIANTEQWKGAMDMAENKDIKKEQEPKEQKPLTHPGDI